MEIACYTTLNMLTNYLVLHHKYQLRIILGKNAFHTSIKKGKYEFY